MKAKKELHRLVGVKGVFEAEAYDFNESIAEYIIALDRDTDIGLAEIQDIQTRVGSQIVSGALRRMFFTVKNCDLYKIKRFRP